MFRELSEAVAAPATGQVAQIDWYLAYTKPRQEHVALSNLAHQGFDAYLPLYKVFGRRPAVDAPPNFEPMFPRYVFFRPAHAGHSVSAVRSTIGVSSIVRFGQQLAVIKPETLEAVRACEQARNAANLAEISPFKTGTAARLRSGALRGLEGLVGSVSTQRVVLLLDLLGRQQAIAVAHHELEPV
jgi:transcriptional antiterminator RfaH